MSDNSNIQWTDATWNPIRGCSLVSPGCTNCYAMKIAHRFSGAGQAYEGLTKLVNGSAVWTGKTVLAQSVLTAPLRWKRPRRIFVNSMSDLFHESVPFHFIDDVFEVMRKAEQHTFQVLTKRPERMLEWADSTNARHDDILGGWNSRGLPNVWLGVSCEDQKRADERIPLLLKMPAAVRFVSAEPLLGPIEFDYLSTRAIVKSGGREWSHPGPGVDWTIVGGESGAGARGCDLEWIRSIVNQCYAEGCPVFVKQLGSNVQWPHLCDPKGGDPAEWPADLRVREFPNQER